MSRVETGPLRFGNDWTGIFIRGDNAVSMAADLEVLNDILGQDNFYQLKLREIINLLTSCVEGKEGVTIQCITNFTHGMEKK
jgi:hypothetical protein